MQSEGPGPAARTPQEDATRQNLQLLVQLRWIAVIGQVLTIGAVHTGLNIALPLAPMATVLLSLTVLNLASLARLHAGRARTPRGRTSRPIRNADLFFHLLFDLAALTVQLHLSGGATNPFSMLYLLQITLAAVLLQGWLSWAILGIATMCFVQLIQHHRPLILPPSLGDDLFPLYIWGMLFCFVLNAGLLVVFTTQITRNLRRHDAALADMRRRAVEEDHIVRMGLLASGAAHELGTPLSTVAVILGDWLHMPALRKNPDLMQDLDEMRIAIRRCKDIVSGILMSSGEARGEAPSATTLHAFLDDLVQGWTTPRNEHLLQYRNQIATDAPIVSDPVLKQVITNVLDNAYEASPDFVSFTAWLDDADLVMQVSDRGSGFSEQMLADFGKPYQSSKGRAGGGLGLFLVVNVFRKLGGRVSARNNPAGGAEVTLVLPLSVLTVADTAHAG